MENMYPLNSSFNLTITLSCIVLCHMGRYPTSHASTFLAPHVFTWPFFLQLCHFNTVVDMSATASTSRHMYHGHSSITAHMYHGHNSTTAHMYHDHSSTTAHIDHITILVEPFFTWLVFYIQHFALFVWKKCTTNYHVIPKLTLVNFYIMKI